MQGLDVRLFYYEDGESKNKSLKDAESEQLDRWILHGSHKVSVTMAGKTVELHQAPQALKASSVGVGAVLWEGELLLAQYLCTNHPQHRLLGSRVVELGAGPGLLGLLLAKLGAQVTITDKGCVCPLIQKNVEENRLCREVSVEELEWGADTGYEEKAASLAAQPVDWVVAADCLYIDGDGQSPSIPHFVRALSLLCSEQTHCFVSFELRSEEVKQCFLASAAEHNFKVQRIPQSALPAGCQVDYIHLYELRKR